MKILSIGTDEKAFEQGSEVRKRLRAYAEAVGALDQIVLSKRRHETQHDGPLTLHPASARSPFMRLMRAFFAGRNLAKPDVISTQDPFETGLIGLLLARRFRVPLHVQVHTDFLSLTFAQHSFLNRIRLRIASVVIASASGIRVVSQGIKMSIEKKYHPRASISVMPVYIDIDRFRNARVDAQLVARFAMYSTKLLVVGRFESEKNIELAIRAYAEVSPHNACLIVVGEGSARAPLQTLARALSISDRVFFEDWQDLTRYYAIADLVLVPSKYEGYGLVIIEALASGKPVLSTDVGIAREAGAIVSSEKDFANALRQWFENGPRQGVLKNYPYHNFDEYIRAYQADIAACTKGK